MNKYEKLEKLKEIIRNSGSLALAFSGGADSAFLLRVAHEVLDSRVLALTAKAPLFSERELEGAKDFCSRYEIAQIVFDFDALDIKGFRENPRERCYICKYALFSEMKALAAANGAARLAEGSNMDDHGDYRPGLKALEELEILSPLISAGFHKKEIRELSKEMGLHTWDKPSYACLASRIAYGEAISEEKLHMVESAEEVLLELGFLQPRVRMHGNMARIELNPSEFSRLFAEEPRRRIVEEFEQLGFTYVSLDLRGYRSGSMNELLD